MEQDTMMRMLSNHIPITLLLDLLAPPDAREVYSTEGGDTEWLAGLRRSAA